MSYSNTQLRTLAQQNPKELIRIITHPICEPTTLASGVEFLGEEASDETLVVPVLLKLLKHSHALVREGALNGVIAFFNNKNIPLEILERLQFIAKNDPLSINREIADDIISE